MARDKVALFLHYWHTVFSVCGALAAGIYLIVHDVRTHPQDTNLLGIELLLFAGVVLVIDLAVLLINLVVRIEELKRQIRSDREELQGVVTARLDKLESRVDIDLINMQGAVTASDFERFKALRKRLDPNLERVYGDHFESQLDNLMRVVESREITLDDLDEVWKLYKKMLPKFANGEFWATSNPSRKFFWRDATIMAANDDFIRNHNGKITRVFFLTEEQPDEEATEIMKEHADVNVKVLYIPLANVPKNLNKLYLVSATHQIAWQATIDASGRLTHVRATVDPKEVDSYRDSFQQLVGLPEIHPFA